MSAYNKLTPELARELETLVGPGRFQYGDRVKEEYSHDEMPIYGRHLPEAVVLTETTEEVSAVLRFCHTLGFGGYKDFRYALTSELRAQATTGGADNPLREAARGMAEAVSACAEAAT